MTTKEKMVEALAQIRENLEKGIIPFWLEKGVDREFGGYITCFAEDGKFSGDDDKMIVTQTRMIWGCAAMYEEYGDERLKAAAKHNKK